MAVPVLFALLSAVAPPRAWASPPANDAVTGATTIPNLPYSESLPYREATYSDSDPISCIAPDSFPNSYRTLWYSLTPSVDERIAVVLSQEGPGVDVFTGSPDSLTRVACHTSYSLPEFRFDAEADTEYTLMVSVNWGSEIDFNMAVDVASPGPVNDDFDSAKVIGTYDFVDSVAAGDAIDSLDDPLCSDWHARNTVWYRYTPPAEARLSMHTGSSTIEGAIAVYRGGHGSLTQVARCMAKRGERLTMLAKPGVTYHIMVGTLAHISGGDLSFTFHSRLVNELSLAASQVILPFGDSVRLTGHLTGFIGGSAPMVSIYHRGDLDPVVSRRVDGAGDFSARLTPTANSIFIARWSGDAHYSSATSDPLPVRVRVVVGSRMVDFYRVIGQYHLYHQATDPIYVVSIRPNHQGDEVVFKIQRYSSGSWRTIVLTPFDLNRESVVGVRITRTAVGVRYRVQGVFKGDDDHLGDSAPWSYFRVTQ